ncbi:MAG: caspase family protein [Vulcanimicrobiota bacterium]
MKRTLIGLLLCTGMGLAEPANPRLVLPVPHTQPVCVLKESPDGRYLASGDTSGAIKIWDEGTRQLQQTLPSQRGGFLPLWMDWLSRDKLVCYGSDFRFHTYDVTTGRQLKVQPAQAYRSKGGVGQAQGKVFFSPFQSNVPVLQEWDPINWTQLNSWDLPAPVESFSLSGRGDRACLLLENSKIIELDLTSKKTLWELPAPPKNLSLHGYSPDGLSVLAADASGLYLLGAGGLRGPFSHPPDLNPLWDDQQVHFLWNKKLVRWDPAHPEDPGQVATGPGLDSFSQGMAHHQMILGVQDGSLIEAQTAQPAMVSPTFSQIRNLVYDQKGRIYAGLVGGQIVCWSLQTGTRETVLPGSSRVLSLALSGDGKLLSVSREKSLDFYDAEKLKLKKSVPLEPGQLFALQSSYDGRYLLGLRKDSYELYDTQTDRLVEHGPRSGCLTLSTLGAARLARAKSGQVVEVELATGKRNTFENYTCNALAYDDQGHLFGLSSPAPGRLLFTPIVQRKLLDLMHVPAGAREYAFQYTGGYLGLNFESSARKWLMSTQEGQLLELGASATPAQVLPKGGSWDSGPIKFLANGSLLAVGREHTVEFWKAGQPAPTGQLIALNDGADWLACDANGLFDGTPAAEHQIEWLVDDRKVRVDQTFEKAYRPGLLKSFAAASTTQVATPVAGLQIVPPQVEFQAPAPGSEIAQRITEVRISVKDQGGGFSPPVLYVNGKAVPQSGRREGDDYLLQAPLQPGLNELRCTALDQSGSVESRGDKLRVTCLAAQVRNPKLMVIAVGLNQAAKATKLNFAEKDAQSLAERLQSPLFASCEVRLLAGDKARTDLIGQAFQDFSKDAQAQDTLVLFLAGHGTLDTQGYHFLMTPGQPDLDGQTLARWLREFPAQKQFVILDTCHAGAVSDEIAASFAVNQQRLARGSGVYMLAACRSEQSALELPSLQHGLLTYSLLEGLKSAPPNSRQQVTVSGLVYFVCSQVPDLCRQVGLSQDVFQFVSGTDFPIRQSGK